ncbi:MAG: hypothetical protein ACP5NZ_05305 [Nanobdellota archaeon]
MRPIESKKEAEKKARKNQIIIGAILIIVMLGSTFGYVMFSSPNEDSNIEKIEYNGYEFVNQNGFWTVTIGEYTFAFRYNPTEVEKSEAELGYISEYSGKPLYVFYENDAAFIEINQNLGSIVQRFQGACLEEEGCPENWPIRDCSNNFVIIKESNESKIYTQEKCTFIEGPRENLTRITDEFLFKITGIEN